MDAGLQTNSHASNTSYGSDSRRWSVCRVSIIEQSLFRRRCSDHKRLQKVARAGEEHSHCQPLRYDRDPKVCTSHTSEAWPRLTFTRAVSYYEIPPKMIDPGFLDKLKDTVPSGIGMLNVQILIVDRQNRNRLCQVGEVGEIYVRAAGLAEGYKDDQALNDQKFLQNWFVDNDRWVEADQKHNKDEKWRRYFKGPRDRLYRTGDLGRYLPSGDMECSGRADDQVKIRGFRIELGDIDKNLGQHVLVRDCRTLVRRDRNEEPTLVSYVVVELKEWSAESTFPRYRGTSRGGFRRGRKEMGIHDRDRKNCCNKVGQPDSWP